MDRVFRFADRPIDATQFLAVAIGETDVDQRHIGILHRTKDKPPKLLHLEWHCRLKNDSAIPEKLTIWVAAAVPSRRQRQVATYCRRIWQMNAKGGVPYGFSPPNESFDPETATFLKGPTQFGLTCASFVLAVFHAAGVPLIEYTTWPADRPGDREWQEKILTYLEHRAEPEHINHVRSEIGAVRFRPEEVAASVALAPPLVSFQATLELAQAIVLQIKKNDAPAPSKMESDYCE